MPRTPSGPIHPLVREMLFGFGRIGVKAFSAGVDSVLEDVDAYAGEVGRRTKKARGKLRKIIRNMADNIAPEEEGEDIDLTNEEE